MSGLKMKFVLKNECTTDELTSVPQLNTFLLPNRRLGLCSVPVPLPALCPRPTTSLHASPIKCNLQGIKIKKIMYDATENDDFDREEIATYEEVAKLYPRPGIYRPIVLIGPPGVGRNELRRRLIALQPDKYKSPVPCEILLQ